MATYNIHAGHNYIVPGASGYFSETKEDRAVKDLVISKLRALGHTVYDCTDNDGGTQSQNLKNIVAKCNAHSVDLDVSIHFNASNGAGHGTEVLLYGNGNHRTIGQNVVDSIAGLGFRNRGLKDGSSLYVVRYTNAPAILIECCFCDNETDAKLYSAESMAAAIVKGITGKTVATSSTSSATTHTISSFFERVVEVVGSNINKRKEPGLNTEVIGVRKVGEQNRVVAKKEVDGVVWLKDCTGYWLSSNYCKDVIYTCKSPVARRNAPGLSTTVIGTDGIGYSHRIKQYQTVDGIKWAQDIAGYWFSTVSKYMTKSLENVKL